MTFRPGSPLRDAAETVNRIQRTITTNAGVIEIQIAPRNVADVAPDPRNPRQHFLGSGTTLPAAERTGRICRGIESDRLCVDIAIRRRQNLTGRNAVRLADGKPFRQLEAEKEREDER